MSRFIPLSRPQHRLIAPFCAITLLALLSCTGASAQALASGSIAEGGASASASTNNSGPLGIVPVTHGFNASLVTSSQHDSSNGWSSVLTPGAAYRFNRFFSINSSIPIYASINIDENIGTKAKPVYVQTTKHGVPGDASLAAQFDTKGFLDYTANLSLGLPTGSTAYGLGAGKPAGDFNNHFEKSFGIFTPDIEFGIGNSSNLIGTRVRKGYTAVGALAHFQIGSSIDLPFNMSFEADAYEQLPLTAATIYSATGKGKKKVTTITGTTSAEDNGFDTSLDIPFSRHVTLSGSYNRSIRSHDDVAGVSLTFLLKAPPRTEESAK